MNPIPTTQSPPTNSDQSHRGRADAFTLAAIAMSVVLAGALVASAQRQDDKPADVSDQITARQIDLVDSEGRVRVRLSGDAPKSPKSEHVPFGPGLTLYDDAGNKRLEIVNYPRGTAMEMWGPGVRRRVASFYTEGEFTSLHLKGDKNVSLTLFGGEVARVTLEHADDAAVVLSAGDQSAAVSIHESKHGSAGMAVGKLLNSDGGQVSTRNAKGEITGRLPPP